ncbi:MAG: AsmA family protein [Betaproteobacteria bacterium]|nr:MAG: AsmA family protein [Betaproteobacteria bacterium]
MAESGNDNARATARKVTDARRRHRRRVGAGIAAVCVAALAAFFLLFDWNWLKSPIQSAVARATGRTLEIGTIEGQWRLHPRIRFEQVRLSNPEWARAPEMLVADSVTMRVAVLPLLFKRMHIYELVLARPEIHLERLEDGRATWLFDKDEEPKDSEPPIIEVVRLDAGVLHYTDALTAAQVVAKLEDRAAPDDARSLKFVLEGKFRGQPLELRGETASVLALRKASEHLPIAVDGTVAGTKLTLEGEIDGLATWDAARLRYDVQGPSLAALEPILRAPLPETPAYAVSGFLNHEGTQWHTSDLKGRVGKSDVSGTVSVDTGGERPRLVAELSSSRLDLADLGPLIGATTRSRLKPTAEDRARLLPNRKLNLSAAQRLDAHVLLRADRVVRVLQWPFDDFMADFRLQDGRITIDPLHFGMADGKLAGKVAVDASGKTPNASLAARMQGVRVAKIAPEQGALGNAAGTLSGRIDLTGRGDSIASMLGTSNGRITLLLSEGNVPSLLPALVDLDGARVLTKLLGKEPESVRCTAFDIAVQNGLATPNVAIVETETTVLTVSGQANLQNEALDLKLSQQPKKASFLSLRTPILVGGTMAAPDLAPAPGPLLARGTAAALLAAINPLAAMFALIETGPGEDGSCPVIQRGFRGEAKGNSNGNTNEARQRAAS